MRFTAGLSTGFAIGFAIGANAAVANIKRVAEADRASRQRKAPRPLPTDHWVADIPEHLLKRAQRATEKR